MRRAPNAPAEAPYDVSAWSLGMQFGVKAVFAGTPLAGDLAVENVNDTATVILEASSTPMAGAFPTPAPKAPWS